MRLSTRSSNFYKNLQIYPGIGSEPKKSRDPVDLTPIINDFRRRQIFNKSPNENDGLTGQLKFPKLLSESIVTHTNLAAEKFIGENLFDKIGWVIEKRLPKRPKKLIFDRGGWIRYENQKSQDIEFPPENCLVYDTENIVSVGHVPVMVVAVSEKAWYTWERIKNKNKIEAF